MKYYIATGLANFKAHNELRDWLNNELGWKITYDWTTHGPAFPKGLAYIQEVAIKELKGVLDADVIIVLWPGGRGTHVELGAALATNKIVYIMSEVDNHHIAHSDTCAFYHLETVQMVKSIEELKEYLKHE